LKKNTVVRRKIFSRILGVLCLANLIGLLFAGLWPFDFSPENKAAWVPGGKGLFFDGKRKPWKRSAGSIAHIPTLKGFSQIPTMENDAFTLAIRLQPASERTGGIIHFLSLVGRSGTEVLYLGQWRDSLIIRWRDSAKDGKRKWREIGAGEALLKAKAQWLTISTDHSGTVIFIDGKTARRFPGRPLPPGEGGLRGCRIVLGNSPQAKSPWTGTISALALYEKSLEEKEMFDGWGGVAGAFLGSGSGHDGLIAAFNLEGGEGERGVDLSGNGNLLEIPSHISVRGRMLEGFDNTYRSALSLTNDAVINMLGFVPFGFFVFWWFKIRRRWNRGRSVLLVVLGGGLVSSAIEMTQAFLPTRSSSLPDVICNVAGAAIGIFVFFLFSLAARTALKVEKSG
jgi:VanZ family protein